MRIKIDKKVLTRLGIEPPTSGFAIHVTKISALDHSTTEALLKIGSAGRIMTSRAGQNFLAGRII